MLEWWFYGLVVSGFHKGGLGVGLVFFSLCIYLL